MSGLLRWIGRTLLWLGPVLIMLLLVVIGFIVWSVGTEPGTRWLVRTAVQQLDGQISDVDGTIWRGLSVGELAVDMPGVSVSIDDLRMEIEWRDLLDRRLHGRNLSMSRLDVNVLNTPDDETDDDDGAFSFPTLPFRIALDRFAIGKLNLTVDDEPFMVNVDDVQASLVLTDQDAQLVFQSLQVGYEQMQADVRGEVRLLELADPWPLAVHIETHAHADQADSLLCVRHFVPDLPTASELMSPDKSGNDDTPEGSDDSKRTLAAMGDLSAACALDLTVTLNGSLDDMAVTVKGQGQDIDFDLAAALKPRASFVLRHGEARLALADGSSLTADLNWNPVSEPDGATDVVTGTLQADRLNLHLLGGAALPAGQITASAQFDARLRDQSELLSARLDANIDPASRWNGQQASGVVQAHIVNEAARHGLAAGAASLDWQHLMLDTLNVDLNLGKNHIAAKGSLGMPDSRVSLDIAVGKLGELWPELPGGVRLTGEMGGSLATHHANLDAVYTPDDVKVDAIGQAPIDVTLAVEGHWGALAVDAGRVDNAPAVTPESPHGQSPTHQETKTHTPQHGWRGRVGTLEVEHAGLRLDAQSAIPITLAPDAKAPAWQWQVGQTDIQLQLPSGTSTVVEHTLSRGGAGRWETQGEIDRLVISRRIIDEVQQLLGPVSERQREDRGRVITRDEPNRNVELIHKVEWALKFAGTLSGDLHIERTSGDLMVPGQPPFPLGLKKMVLDVTAKPAGERVSQLTATLDAATAEMGQATVTATALLRSTPDGGFVLNESDPKTIDVNANIGDLSWLSLFTGDVMDFGGAVQADVQAKTQPNGTWSTSGTVTGQGIRVIRIDDGVRLLDGELHAHFDNNRFILDRLYFPARLRVTPKEWRTAEWVQTNPEAQDGGLTLTGSWNLFDSVGGVDIEFYRYPLLQRSDRYAMVSGKLTIDAPFPHISVSGELTADAGWIDLDMLSSVPTLDSDVVVLRPGEEEHAPGDAPTDISLDLTVDLGPRFYITGYGVDSGLVGQLRILMKHGKLTAQGALRTRGGAIDIYGQHLQLRRGTITFQGDIMSPTLNIEALRTGVAVEAGVRVAGTARHPRIDLVSYPDVSDVQKLSWLLLGRGPEDSGNDAALLLSVGTSFLGDGEPFYRRFGLDELSMRSGELGSTGSILPVESVVRGLDSGTSDIERQFVVASKRLGRGFTLSLEQALSDTGTVGRASYRLMRGLTAELSVGTVNGIALIYRRFFGN